MQFWSLDLPERRLKLDRAVERMMALEGPWEGDAVARLQEQSLSGECAQALGTIGGGNHFCELQGVVEIVDHSAARSAGVVAGGLALLVHSGSRGLGAATLARHAVFAAGGLSLAETGRAYLAEHDIALRFAKLNRQVIAERALDSLRADGRMTLDIPHNLAERRGDFVLHRKGAAPSDRGLVPIPGSRGAATYLVDPLPAPSEALAYLAHGAGRKHDRGSMEKRTRTGAGDIERLARNPFGGRVICRDRKLLIEEAPEAYKDIRRVVGDLESLGLARVVAILRPLITFKTARENRRERS